MRGRGLQAIGAWAIAACISSAPVAGSAQHGATAHGPATATVAHDTPAPKAPDTKPAANTAGTHAPAAPPAGSHATPASSAAPSPTSAPKSGTNKPRPVSVVTVVQRIQQRIEKEVKPAAAATKRSTSGQARATVTESSAASSRRIALRWRVALDWPSELQ